MKKVNLGLIVSFILICARSQQEEAGEVAMVDDSRLRNAGNDDLL